MSEDELLTLTEAREFLGISKTTFAKLVREGTLSSRTSRLDKRVKFVRRADVESLKREARRPRRGDVPANTESQNRGKAAHQQ